ncbi:PREDICTED: 14-3-3-like protein GF14 epsilon [Camelina sativa]|uniref:14-3-3-like protein GF14 epsilon n=1 Tax=Camelina sativa TaxID=90675 RepID=A0ABM0TNI2_CAMSA|nr:PREDICTED: 14-3-3-like protein GF14 epsilon [Camelina sativa]
MENEREKLVYLAKLACQTERYDDTIKSMRKVCEYDIELSKEEIDLLTTGYKEVMLTKRHSLKVISTIGEMEDLKGNEQKVKLIKGKQEMVKDEFFNVCNDILFLIDAHLIPSTTNVESIIFFHRMKGDYYRYMTEFGSDAERKETADNSLEAYKVAMEMAENSLAPTNLVRLGLALNFSVFSYDILNATERAYKLAKQAYDEAVAELDGLDDKQKDKEMKIIINMLKYNLSVWTSDHDHDEHDSGIPKNKKDE